MGFQRQSNWMGKTDGGHKTDQIVQEKALRQVKKWSTKMMEILIQDKLVGEDDGGGPKTSNWSGKRDLRPMTSQIGREKMMWILKRCQIV